MAALGTRDVRRLGDFLREQHGAIIAAWERAVARLRPAEFLPRPVLLDHIPQFLAELAEFVGNAPEHPDAAPPSAFPVIHAIERLDLGYDLAEVVSEYAILRRCITTLAQGASSPALLSAELPLLHDAIDSAIRASVVRYSTARERTLKALDRISTAALSAGEDTPKFLHATLAALLETTPAIDSASILLIEGARLCVRASAGFAQSPAEARCLASGECFAGRIWQARAPLLIRDAETDPKVTTDTIRRRGTHAMYGAPIAIGEEMMGVVMVGSSSTYELSSEDLLIVRTAFNRVATLIANGRKDEALRRQTALYESVVSALGEVGEGFAVLEGVRFLTANGAFCHMVARGEAELRALPDVFELVAPEEREALRARVAGLGAGDGSIGRVEVTFLRAGGGRIEAEVGLKRKLTGRVVAVVHDASARNRQARELAAQRQRLATVLDVLPVGIVLADAPAGNVTLDNAEARRIWGRPVDPASVQAYGDFEGYWPDGRRIAAEDWPLARALATGEATAVREIHIVSADGVRRIVDHRCAPIRDGHGAVIAAVVTLVDITDRKRMEDELRGALAFRDQIIDILAHDLRQPLSVIGASAQVLRQRGADEAVLERQIRNVQRMDRLIRDLLDYARAKAGSIPLVRRPVDVAEVARNVVGSAQMLDPGREIAVTARGDCTAHVDPDRLAQVLTNLVSNACAYSPAGSPVEITVREEGGEVLCAVHNSGDPIPPDRLGNIFDPFRRGTSRANPQGLGLGLYIVEQIVRAHGGTVQVKSTAQEGTTFRVRVPKHA